MLSVSPARLCQLVLAETKKTGLVPSVVTIGGFNIPWRDALSPKQACSIEAIASMHAK